MLLPARALTVALHGAAVIGILIVVLAELPGTATATRPPALQLSTTTLSTGETVTITGKGWPGSQDFQAAVCGNGSQAVSQDCDLVHAIDFSSNTDGAIGASLVVAVPPVHCPCVVLVTEVDLPYAEYTLPLRITGAPSGPLMPPPPPARAVTISHVHVVSKSSWTSWFGAAAPRELILTVHNGEPYPVLPLLIAHVVQGSQTYVITSPPPRTLPVGGTAQITAPFALSTFAHGGFDVVGTVIRGNDEGEFVGDGFSLSTSTTPWALYVLVLVLGAGVVALLARALMRRLRSGDQPPIDPPGQTDLDDDTTAELVHIGAAP
jgi:hypothetical protein